MRLLAIISSGLLLSGCGAAQFASAPSMPNDTESKAIRSSIYTTFASLKLPGSPEISPLHENKALGTPADFAICLRSTGGNGKYVVFLISQGKVVDYRSAVGLDRCNEQTYAPLRKP